MTGKITSSVFEQMAYHKNKAIPEITRVVFYISVFVLPFSMMRYFTTGWQHIYTFELVCTLVLGVICFYRKTIPTLIQAWIILVFDVLISIYCLITFGIIGSGVLIALSCILFCMFFINLRSSLVVGSILLAVYLYAMYLFVEGGKSFPVDEKMYISTFSSWGIVLVGSVFLMVKIIMGIFNQQRHSFSMLVELEERNLLIQNQRESLEKLANQDHLTGLPSLRLAHQKLELAINESRKLNFTAALFFLDLDGFKTINDSYGHSIGDSVLQVTAARITSVIRDVDVACRIGGDEFIVIINKVETQQYIENLCNRLIEAINQPIVVAEFQAGIGVSIGAVTCSASSQDDAKSLMQKADELMYKVKSQGKNNYELAQY